MKVQILDIIGVLDGGTQVVAKRDLEIPILWL